MTSTIENLRNRLVDLEKQEEALRKQIKPLSRRLTAICKVRDKAQEDLNNEFRGDFDYLLSNRSAWKQMKAYLVASQGAPHDYWGVRVDGFYEEGPRWAFDLSLEDEASLPAAQVWIETHLSKLKPIEIRGHDDPLVTFSYSSESHGLYWIGWDGKQWLMIKFTYGSIRDANPVADLKTALTLARQRVTASDRYDDDDED
jgi:hypothetical protein